jgi:hypothetical protein
MARELKHGGTVGVGFALRGNCHLRLSISNENKTLSSGV